MRLGGTRRARFGLLVVLGTLLGACSAGSGPQIAPQQWGRNQVSVETRPAPVRQGMNEFLVLVTAPGRLPVYDLMVELRLEGSAAWGQAIQDGDTGVFRKALRVRGSGPQRLYVRLRPKQGQVTQLEFRVPAQSDAGATSG